jgi:prepilin-type processing-associated H-X9-DG protein
MAVAVIEPVRPMLAAGLAQAPLPPPFADVKRLPELIDAAKIDLVVTGEPLGSLVLLSPDDAAAEDLETILNRLLDTGQQMALAQIASDMESDDPVEQAGAQYAQRITKRMIEMFRPQRTGHMLRVSQEGEAGGQVAVIGVLVALLLPAVQAAREAARRASSTNNLKQIALAMHNYHDAHSSLPPRASFDADGNPLLSWRVHILPYVEEQALYEQFHLDEPWDSEHNRQFIDSMPPVYRNPSSAAEPNKANYLVPTGPGSIFEGKEGASFRDITDGTSNTILVLEVNDDASVVWTKPDDFNYDTDDPLAGLGTAHPGGFNVALADGAVRFISRTIDPELFLRLLMKADGQPVGQY